MRVSSLTFYTSSLAGMQNQQAAIARLNQQIATGQRLLAPKDDPVAANRALELSDRIALRQQHQSNQQKAELALDYEMTVVQEMRKAMNDARALLTGISPSHDQTLREQHSDLVTAAYQHLKDLANSRDPSGNHIFAGYETAVAPFDHVQAAPGGVNSPATDYRGSLDPDGIRSIEVDTGRDLQVNDNLERVIAYDADRDGSVEANEHDVLRALDQAAIDLRDPAVTQAQIDAAIAALDVALQALGGVERRISADQVQLADIQATTQALLTEEENALTDILELDNAAAIMELQLRQTQLEAAQRAYATTAQLSLFDYL